MIQDGCFENASEAHIEIFGYIEGCSSTQRKHSAIGYQTPSQFETQFHPENYAQNGPGISCTSIRHVQLDQNPFKTASNAKTGVSQRAVSGDSLRR